MPTAAISGVELWHNTEFGKALAKILPPELTRVIIDIPCNGAVKIYYTSIATGPILDLKWDEIIEQLEVVKPQEEPQYICARCGFRTYEEDVINKHSAECKVPLNKYG